MYRIVGGENDFELVLLFEQFAQEFDEISKMYLINWLALYCTVKSSIEVADGVSKLVYFDISVLQIRTTVQHLDTSAWSNTLTNNE